MRTRVALSVLCIYLVTPPAEAQTTWHVDDDNCLGPGSGTGADPLCTIQSGIDAAIDGDEVIVAPGMYNELVDFIGKAITLRSSDGPEVTTIDGTGLNDSVVMCMTGEGRDTVLEGFTITGGLAPRGGGMFNVGSQPTVTNCIFVENSAESLPFVEAEGGGMYNYLSNPAVTNCVFRRNRVWAAAFAVSQGGGMYNEESSPTIHDCIFEENTVELSLDTYTQGAGMYNLFSSPEVSNCQFIRNYTGGSFHGNEGAGMYNESSSPAVIDCTFDANVADLGAGGGISNAFDSNPIVTHCTFVENEAPFGAGMDNCASSPTVTDCLFRGNVGNIGGGMDNCDGSNPMIRNCAFSRNLAGVPDTVAGRGGGMRNNASSPTVINCVFSGNVAYGTEQWGGGGGMFNNYLASPRVTNCTFVNNEAGATGGAIYNFQGGSPTLINCSFIGNTAGQSGGVMYNTNTSYFESSPSMANCILWGNSHDQVFDGLNAATTIRHSDIEQGWTGDGGNNIDADPLFVDADGPDDIPGNEDDNLRLQPGSPCIDAADNSSVPEDVETDLDGNPRIVDGDDDGQPVVDMGPYEHQPCPADLDDDGQINAADLAQLLGSWGQCDDCYDCPADFNDDCAVNAADLAVLLGSWGPCS
ncbi:MAG: hypothetical protein O7D91_01915 [Planctomycetota bacterium]|nr:hypothetical protein [Planctomycetota bacterium]